MLISISLLSCGDGDYLGPVERTLRSAFNGWDMWFTEGVSPYELPMPGGVEGTIPVTGKSGYEQGVAEMKRLDGAKLKEKAYTSYRRFCHHCHGANGDGRIIAGESFDVIMPDLRSDAAQSLSDHDLYSIISGGFGKMLPLADTMTPLDIMLSISHMRSLKNAPSEPFFERKFTDF
ncbi:MAG: cytochrome c [Deltaproteobacteria bacterium]|nr:cytochrome c [Deltaproteobacteria bacterium]